MKEKIGIIDYVWAALIALGVVYGLATQNVQTVTESAINYADKAVNMCLKLIGTMTLWLGIMRIAEKSGLTAIIAKGLKPIMIKIFPGVPPEHPAMGAMIMNISANILGLGNAATPFGLKAMKELDSLNRIKGEATNAMVMFLAINASSVTLLPATVIALRQAAGSANPTVIIGPTIMSTSISTLFTILFCIFLSKFKRYRRDSILTSKKQQRIWSK